MGPIDLRVVLLSALVTILVLGLIAAVRLSQADPMPEETMLLREAIPQMDDGDLVAISYRSIHGKLVKIFTGMNGAHVGMIVRQAGQPHVLEMTHRGPKIRPFRRFLRRYDDKFVLWARHQGKPIRNIRATVERCPGVLDLSVVTWVMALFNRQYQPPSPNKHDYFCSEYIAHILQELGVMRKVHRPSSYAPDTLIFGRMPLHPGHRYHPAVRLF